MAETTVAMAPLIREMIEQGAEFVRALEQHGVAILAAFWFLLAEAGRWRLFIATPDIGRIGWQELYGKAHRIRDKLAPEPAFGTCNTRRRWRRLVCARGWWGGRAKSMGYQPAFRPCKGQSLCRLV